MCKRTIDLTQYIVIGCGLIPITNVYLDTIYEQDEDEYEDNKNESFSRDFIEYF